MVLQIDFYSARNKYTERELQVCHMSLSCIKHMHPFSCYFHPPAPPTFHRSIQRNVLPLDTLPEKGFYIKRDVLLI